jgi:hypothetical protein
MHRAQGTHVKKLTSASDLSALFGADPQRSDGGSGARGGGGGGAGRPLPQHTQQQPQPQPQPQQQQQLGAGEAFGQQRGPGRPLRSRL